ncbi:MAG TPA: 6-bladed beta-propeller [Solirubrobacterales bacterium]|nr:6-bladed beta-propeller [Solirubrobacterales bacterium]
MADSPGAKETPEVAVPAESSASLPTGADLAEATQKVELNEEERERELEAPAAEAEREESRSAYEDADSASEASDLLRMTFQSELESLNLDPARFLSDAALKRSLPEGGAVVSNEGQPEIMEAGVPAQVRNKEGEMSKVDLSLEATSEGFEPANPITDVNIPISASEGISLENGTTTITQAGVNPESSAHLFDDKDVIYPDVQTDTDLLVSPLSTGVELFDQLRSAKSPETLRFDLGLPEGAELRANAGTAEVYEGEKLLGIVAPPHAVDAQGTLVPVTMGVEGNSIILTVEHREGNYAYPILVDPEYVQNDWVNNAWIFGYRYDVLEDGTFLPNSNNAGLKISRWCIYSCWGSGRGLFVSVPSGTWGGGQWAQWTYTPPGETSYLSGYLINPFYRYDFSSPCWSGPHPEPHDYDGLWSPTYNIYYQLYTNRALYTNASIYGNTAQTAKVMVFGMSTGGGANDPCWRDLYAGGIATYMTDPDSPTLDPISGYPTGWFDDSKKYGVNVSAHDHGLGVRNISLLLSGTVEARLNQADCEGTHDSPCYRDMAGTINFNGDLFPEGKSEAKVVANDALLRPSNKYSWTAYVDNTSPEVTLSGQLAEATKEEGPKEKPQGEGNDKLRLPVYNLEIKAEDGSTASEQAMRSGVKNIEVFLDKKTEPEPVSWKPQGCSGPNYSCPMTETYTLNLTGLGAGEHVLKVVASDQLEHKRIREIQFKYIPATGMKEEYVLQHFPLPDGQGNEAEEEHPSRPELAVNVMNGNLVYRQQDIDVPGYSADLEVERFYNSQLPESQSTEWGKGWTLAQTPKLELEKGAAPKEAELLDESGAVASGVGLPIETGEAKFDPAIKATLTKEAGGGYEMADESGETNSAFAFGSSGRTEELRTGPYSNVDYGYEVGKLSEIAIKDPASAPDPSPAEEEAFEYVPPAPSYQSAFGALGSGEGQLKSPGDIAIAANGDLLVVDKGNNRVERFNQEGKFVSKFGSEGTGNGQFKRPCSIAIDASGNLYVADAGNNRIEKFNEKGEFLKAVGSYGAGNAQFHEPEGITVDAKGNVLVADSYNQRIQKFNSALEFLSKFGSSGSGNGQFNQVNSIDVGPGGKVWVIDWGLNRVTEFNEAGEYVQQFGSYGTGNGQFNHPDAIEVDSRGDVFVGDQSNNRVQEFSQSGKYLTQFGAKGSGNGQFSFTWPMGIAVDNKGGLWVTDVSNNRIEKWSVPNYRPSWYEAFGTVGAGDGQLKTPSDVAIAPNGDLFVVDKGNNRVERFNREGKFVSKFGTYGTGNGQFSTPTSIAIDGSNHLWVADGGNSRVEEFTESGEFLKAVGSYGTGNAQFHVPEGIATDLKGDVLVADTYNRRIQVFSEEGEFLFKFGSAGSDPGQFTEANAIDIGRHGSIWVADWGANRIEQFNEAGEYVQQFGAYGTGEGQFNHPDAIEADNKGNVWVGDESNSRVELFNEAGEYITQFGSKGSGEGQFSFTYPMGIVVDSSGRLWITDVKNNRIQKWQIPSTEAPKPPEENDPAVDVSLNGGLVSSVEGKEAGTHSYAHSGQLLTSASGLEGKTSYEYDSAGRMTKVTLPNGTWGSIAYESTYGRVSKVTVDPAGSEPAKTTLFNYSDEPRRTTVTPESTPAVVYDIGADGSVFSWAERQKTTNLQQHRGKPLLPQRRRSSSGGAGTQSHCAC